MEAACKKAKPDTEVRLHAETEDLGLFKVEVDGQDVWNEHNEFPKEPDIVALLKSVSEAR